MRWIALVVLGGCSFFAVGKPPKIDPAIVQPSAIGCKESSPFPTVDVIGGAGAVIGAGAGVILEQSSDDGEPKHFTAYYAGPLVAVAIAYFWAASVGNKRLAKCEEMKKAAGTAPVAPVTPIDQQQDTEDPNRK